MVGWDSPWPAALGYAQGSGEILLKGITNILFALPDETFEQVVLQNQEFLEALAAWRDKPKIPAYSAYSEYERLAQQTRQLANNLLDTAERSFPDQDFYLVRKQWRANQMYLDQLT